MNKETTGSTPVNVLTDPIGDMVKTENGRYAVKQAAAVIFVSQQIANGVPPTDALRSAEGIFHQTRRRQIQATFESAKLLMHNGI